MKSTLSRPYMYVHQTNVDLYISCYLITKQTRVECMVFQYTPVYNGRVKQFQDFHFEVRSNLKCKYPLIEKHIFIQLINLLLLCHPLDQSNMIVFTCIFLQMYTLSGQSRIKLRT